MTIVEQPGQCGLNVYHYVEFITPNYTQYYIQLPPYRIVNREQTSYVDIYLENNVMEIMVLPLIHLDTEENLRKRLKNILLFS